MPTEVRVPALPESVADATVLTWHFQPGDRVRRDDNLVDLETDKVVLEVPAPADGVLADAAVAEGDIVTADSVLGHIEAQQEGAASEAAAPAQTASAPAPAPQTTQPTSQHTNDRKQKASAPEQAKPPGPGPKAAGEPAVAPAARRLIKEMGLDPTRIPGSGKGGRITKADVIAWLDEQEAAEPAIDPDAAAAARSAPDAEPPEHGVLQPPGLTGEAGRPEQRVRMTRLRARIAERLVDAQKTTAMLTTFNEVDMEAVLALRRQYKEQFEKTHNVRLGLMSFFVKAAVEALQRFPIINASVDGDDIIYHGYYDIGIAVSADRGLVVPILRNCDQLSMADVERGIVDFATKAKDGSLSFEELTGGTFSITNGGVFGSLLSTPILNLPQSAILGMHSIQERPVAVDGEIVIRPMMYLALSYDHRIVDGREAVQFLMTIKQTLEDPARLLLRI
jgi:2-oxoglutarate dehydrogenase E2 component (dihydrolipoamide succinyltransferase)